MKKFFLILSAILILNVANRSAEDLKFIDALDDTGYYYDADTVKIEGENILSVKMAVIKASLNRMYTYDLKINRANRKYEILSSCTHSYNFWAIARSQHSGGRYQISNWSVFTEWHQMRFVIYICHITVGI